MPRQVTIGSGKHNVQLPDGGHYDDGDVVVLTDAQWDQISSTAVSSGTIVDNGEVDAADLVSVQAAVVAAPAATTSVAPAALTAAAAATNPPTKVEFDKVVADNVAQQTTLAATQADVAALRTTVANLLTALKGTGKPMASS